MSTFMSILGCTVLGLLVFALLLLIIFLFTMLLPDFLESLGKIKELKNRKERKDDDI